MKIRIWGDGHLAETWTRALGMRGFEIVHTNPPGIVLIAVDVLDHTELDNLREVIDALLVQPRLVAAPAIALLLSQVPPGWCRKLTIPNLYYMVDTIIVSNALDRVLNPEQVVIGASNCEAALPLALQQFFYQLYEQQTGIAVTTYETAEVAKLAINYHLARQIETSHHLKDFADAHGANYASVERILRNDQRIGRYAYLRPGDLNQHLKRDVDTIKAWQERPRKMRRK